MMERQTFQTSQKEGPPVPKKIREAGGYRKTPGLRVKFAATLDLELWSAFEKYRLDNGITASRAWDIITWNFFGKPRLSFQEPAGVENERD